MNPVSISNVIWSVLALSALVAIGFALRAERRRFAARNMAGAWLWVRLASVPIMLLAAAAVWLSARAVGGPESLAAFYLLMFTLAPAIYFGLHWLAGRLATPALSALESAAIGSSGLLVVILPAMLVSMASPWVYSLSGSFAEASRALASDVPLPHRIVEHQRFLLPEIGEVLTERWQAPAGIRVERLEAEIAGQYLQVDNSTGSIVCRDGEDFHVFRSAAEPAPRWRMYWRDDADRLNRSDWSSSTTGLPAQALTPVRTAEGVKLPTRIPSHFVILERRWPTGRVQQFDPELALNPGARNATCLPLIYRNSDGESVLTQLTIRMWLSGQRRMGMAVFPLPDA